MLLHKTIVSGADSPPLTMTRLRMLTMIYINTDSNNTRTTLLILATTEIAYSKPCVASFWNKIGHSSVKKTTLVLFFWHKRKVFLQMTLKGSLTSRKNCTAKNHSFLWLGIPSLRKMESLARTTAKAVTTPENDDLIGGMRTNTRAAPTAHTLVQLFDVVHLQCALFSAMKKR